MTFEFGIDRLLASSALMNNLRHKRVGLVAHPASITSANQHSLDALMQHECHVIRAFGPQHGMRGDKQDNMIESEDYLDPLHQIPIVSLYAEHRCPTAEMIQDLDVVLYDLQDVGCRIYTYISTLKYFVQACAEQDKELWVLDRPNPAGRPIDGLILQPGQQSFVGCDELPCRHGLTIGELACWFNTRQQKQANIQIIEMTGYRPDDAPDFGWPTGIRPWINPSPNAASLNMTRCFPGTVLIEGTTLSEGRGSTVPLEVIGSPDFPTGEILACMRDACPDWLEDAYLRPCYFEPTFHKHVGEMCAGLQIHTDYAGYDHSAFKPYRLVAGLLKSLRQCRPDFDLWRSHEYEYEPGRLPIDVINGGAELRNWVDDSEQGFAILASMLQDVEDQWQKDRLPFLRY